MTAVDGFTPLIGGIPIVIDGQVVGGIGVSGAASANQDEELALAGAAVFSNSVLRIHLVHRLEPFLQRWKYQIGAYLKRLLQNHVREAN